MKKYFVSSDIHSFYHEWREALDKAGFSYDNPDHIIIVCGDLFDRGTEAYNCLNFVNRMADQNRAILIRGNHETLFQEMIERGFYKGCDIHNGTDKTAEALAGEKMSDYAVLGALQNNKELNKYFNNLVNYAEIGDRIFVHGWLPLVEDWRNAHQRDWDDAAWENGMYQWAIGYREKGKTIYCGHWHASYGNANYHEDGAEFPDKFHPYANFHSFVDDGIVALDACTVLSGFVNVEVFEE